MDKDGFNISFRLSLPKEGVSGDDTNEETIKNETNENEKDAIDALSKLGKEILITPKLESKFDVKSLLLMCPTIRHR